MIDFKFIQNLEGNELNGYVPDPAKSMSGVTIASGFDIGARNADELKRAFPSDLAQKLVPYANLKRLNAQALLNTKPLSINDEEAALINNYAKQTSISRLIKAWTVEPDKHCQFRELDSVCKTVIASVAFQYGDLKTKAPNFWEQVVKGQWSDALNNLRNFGDRYATRRNKEADLLESWMAKNT